MNEETTKQDKIKNFQEEVSGENDGEKEKISSQKGTSEKTLEQIKKERAEYLEGWQRERANFANYKKEERERFNEVIRFSNERIIKELIPVIDSFDLAIQSFNKEDEKDSKYLKGICLIKSQLEDILRKEGVEEIKVKKGDVFDFAFHEAVTEAEDEKLPPHTILEVLEKGYLLKNKIVRPARVVVVKERNPKS